MNRCLDYLDMQSAIDEDRWTVLYQGQMSTHDKAVNKSDNA